MLVRSYERTRLAKALAQTKQFWNIHRTWAHFVPVVVGFVVFGVKRFMLSSGPSTLINAALIALIWAVCFYAVAWVGSLTINYLWSAPFELDRAQQAIIERLNEAISAGCVQPPEQRARSVLMERWRAMVTEVHTKMQKSPNRLSAMQVLEEHPDFLSIRPYLSEETRTILYHGRTFVVTPDGSTMDGMLHRILDDIERLEQEWGLRP